MFCPLHQQEQISPERNCPKCKTLGVVAVSCELDKVRRVLDSMEQQGYELDHYRVQDCFGLSEENMKKKNIKCLKCSDTGTVQEIQYYSLGGQETLYVFCDCDEGVLREAKMYAAAYNKIKTEKK